VFSAHLTV